MCCGLSACTKSFLLDGKTNLLTSRFARGQTHDDLSKMCITIQSMLFRHARKTRAHNRCIYKNYVHVLTHGIFAKAKLILHAMLYLSIPLNACPKGIKFVIRIVLLIEAGSNTKNKLKLN